MPKTTRKTKGQKINLISAPAKQAKIKEIIGQIPISGATIATGPIFKDLNKANMAIEKNIPDRRISWWEKKS